MAQCYELGKLVDVIVGDQYRFSFGCSGGFRAGTVLAIDGTMVLVRWHYNIPNSWTNASNIC